MFHEVFQRVETSKIPGIMGDYRSLTLPLGELTCEPVVHAWCMLCRPLPPPGTSYAYTEDSVLTSSSVHING